MLRVDDPLPLSVPRSGLAGPRCAPAVAAGGAGSAFVTFLCISFVSRLRVSCHGAHLGTIGARAVTTRSITEQ